MAAVVVLRPAALPSWLPEPLTADTPGYPVSVHACPDLLVKFKG